MFSMYTLSKRYTVCSLHTSISEHIDCCKSQKQEGIIKYVYLAIVLFSDIGEKEEINKF